MNIVITGIDGFLGSALENHWGARGHDVVGTSRRGWSAGVPFPRALLEHADLLLHAAHDLREGSAEINLDMASRLIEAARASAGLRVIFISSASAAASATSEYGHTKFRIERLFLDAGYSVIRPGLVIGPGGLFARTAESVRRSRVVPLVEGGRLLVPVIALRDLLEALTALLSRSLNREELNLFLPKLVTQRDMVERIWRTAGRRGFILPVSASLAFRLLRLTKALCLPVPFREDNLRSILESQSIRHSSDLPGLIARPTPFEEAPI